MAADFDLAILGSGFSGSLLAMIMRRLGKSVLLLERGAHPRFAIGESSSPVTNLVLEELARTYDLPRLLPLTAYGPWKRSYPGIGVGLKRGFTFYAHVAGERFEPPERDHELLVAASPSDDVADTHWYRAEFDQFLMEEARALGAEYVDRVAIGAAHRAAGTWTLSGEREGRTVTYRARFLVDATGPRGALSRMLEVPEAGFEEYPATQGLFSHFTDVPLFAELIGAGDEAPPYAPDAAALHHVFDGGWMWVLHFDNGITSAGFAVEDRLARELRLEEGAAAWARLLERYPGIRLHLADAKPVLPFVHARRLPYRASRAAGSGWALLPSAAAFVDPLFSTGFALTLLGIQRLVPRLTGEVADPGLDDYSATTLAEADSAARLVSACYALFGDFPRFAAMSMFYFVAASFSEMARRLGRGELVTRYLAQNQPEFRAAFEEAAADARRGAGWPMERVGERLEPFNIAGLCDPAKRNRYGVDLNDVVRGAAKLGVTSEQAREFFTRMGW